ncbi:hypothetical protein [Arcanobacterium phocae]|uniref:hypothetical protein n=1 Tax=Arcanobacterium phocae TaxID=131112 RepID=UPI001C0EDC81|nr:hypothetical protein [Arcanobacterium phocae]
MKGQSTPQSNGSYPNTAGSVSITPAEQPNGTSTRKREFPADPTQLITPQHYNQEKQTEQPAPPTPHSTPTLDTAYNQHAPWEDGIWIRKGWAGRYRE